jgi:hypothetical protein
MPKHDETCDLIEIYQSSKPYGVTDTVRWCRLCGSIVVDADVDGIIHPGAIREMQFPELARSMSKLKPAKQT